MIYLSVDEQELVFVYLFLSPAPSGQVAALTHQHVGEELGAPCQTHGVCMQQLTWESGGVERDHTSAGVEAHSLLLFCWFFVIFKCFYLHV